MAELDPMDGSPALVPFNFKQSISQMVQRNGSDLLLKVGRPPSVRINGELAALAMQPVRPEDLKQLAEQIMTPRQSRSSPRRRRPTSPLVSPVSAGSGPTSTSSAEPWRSPSGPFPTR
jgi:hypothetical protein